MVLRYALALLLLLPTPWMLCGQDPGSFPPAKPYRIQLQERGPVRNISLRDAIATALQYNLEIELEGYNRELSQAGTTNAYSYYDTVAGFNTSIVLTDLPVTNILQTGGFGSQITKAFTASPNIQQNLPGGGAVTLSFNFNKISTNSDYALVNPVFGSTIGITVTQPLWRGFLRTPVERQIVVARLNERMNESQFRQRAAGVVEQVINAYWRLALTIENYEVQRQRREVAVLEYEQTKNQNTGGQSSSSLISQRAEVASHDQSLTQAAVQIAQAANSLKRLLAPSLTDPLWAMGLIASDRPEQKLSSPGMEEALKTALDRRPELERLRLQLKQADAEIRFDRQETKPSVNLRLEALSTGNAGPIVGNLPPGQASLDLGGLGASYREALEFQHPSLAAGLEVRFPLRNRAAKSQLTTAILGERKLQTQLRAAEEDIAVDVRNAWETLGAQQKNLDAAVLSRRWAEERLTAEMAKRTGNAPSLDVSRDQADLTEARARELQALIEYQLSMVSLERAMDTLLDEQQVVLARRKK